MKVRNNFDLSQFNSYRIKSHCRRAYWPDTEEDLVWIFQNVEKPILLGSGHNIILSKTYFDENFVILHGNFGKVRLENKDIIVAESGATMLHLTEFALSHSISGLEIFYDIPSSVGGAVVMNAGASGEEIKDILIKVRYLDVEENRIINISKESIGFEYRNSFFQKNPQHVILKAWLKLTRGNKDDIQEKMDLIKAQRWAKQPREFPNAGSVFKRPKGYYVGAIMDELGLKGYSLGGAKISEKHGGFIVNYDNASGEDIIGIIRYVNEKVRESFGFELEVEQRII